MSAGGVTIQIDHDQSVALAAALIGECIETNRYLVRVGIAEDDPKTRAALLIVYEYLTGTPYFEAANG